MDREQRPLLRTRYKVLFWIAGLSVAWHILVTAEVAEALLAFCFGGVVPGTDMVLAPSTVLWIIGGLFLLSASALILFMIGRWVQYRHFLPDVSIKPEQKAVAVVKKSKALPKALAPSISRSKMLQRTRLHFVWKYLSKWAAVVARKTGQIWHGAQPYIWRVDGLMELQVRKFETYTRKKGATSDTLRLLQRMCQQYGVHIKESIARVIIQLKHRAVRYKRK